VNVVRAKKLTNIRAAGKDENTVLTPPRALEIEWALEWMEDDELLEVTPQTLRLRKRVLAWSQRKALVLCSGLPAGTPRGGRSPAPRARPSVARPPRPRTPNFPCTRLNLPNRCGLPFASRSAIEQISSGELDLNPVRPTSKDLSPFLFFYS